MAIGRTLDFFKLIHKNSVIPIRYHQNLFLKNSQADSKIHKKKKMFKNSQDILEKEICRDIGTGVYKKTNRSK